VKKRHPGATGHPRWIDWKLTDEQRADLIDWLSQWKLDHVDERAFLDAVESHVRLYVQMVPVAEESSAKAVRRNLKDATKTAGKLLMQINQFDGNSSQLAERRLAGGSILDRAIQMHEVLREASQLADDMFPRSGRRPEHERDGLAAQLAEALEMHTSARPTATRAKIFEELLIHVFGLVGKHYTDLHRLAERVLERRLISRPTEGLLVITTHESAPIRAR
jgi:hypothetical protein